MNQSHNTNYSRAEIAKKLENLEALIALDPSVSQRRMAEELGVPRNTLQHWLKRREQIDAEPQLIDFLESSLGLAFLHRLVIGSAFALTMIGNGSPRTLALLLQLTGLDRFVACSVGSLYSLTVQMEEAIIEFGSTEQKRLALQMTQKKITACQDETFHPEICLVAIEAASNYILLEKYVKDRKAATWNKEMQEALSELPVEVIQSTSDEGVAICSHIKNSLQAHHSPDLFHVQQELVKATAVALRRQLREAQKAEVDANKGIKAPDVALGETDTAPQEADGETDTPPQPTPVEQGSKTAPQPTSVERGSKTAPQPTPTERASRTAPHPAPTDLKANMTFVPAVCELPKEAASARQKAQERIDTVATAIKKINQVYHPFNLQSGEAVDPQIVGQTLQQQFSKVEKIAHSAELSVSAIKRIQKAKRVLSQMVATLTFFFLTIRAKVTDLMLEKDVEEIVLSQLIPAIYLDLCSKRTSDRVERKQLVELSSQLLSKVNARDGPLSKLSPQELVELEKVAIECAQLFQRSSSCVEGRNGHLALWHHSWSRLSERKLSALTTVHNFFIKRADGTTAAERFFGTKPKELFPWLLERLTLLGRPAQKRPRPMPAPYLDKVA